MGRRIGLDVDGKKLMKQDRNNILLTIFLIRCTDYID